MLNMTDYIEFNTLDELFDELLLIKNKDNHAITVFFKDNEEDIISTNSNSENSLVSLYNFLDIIICDELSHTLWTEDREDGEGYKPHDIYTVDEVECLARQIKDYSKALMQTYKRICNQYAVRVW